MSCGLLGPREDTAAAPSTLALRPPPPPFPPSAQATISPLSPPPPPQPSHPSTVPLNPTPPAAPCYRCLFPESPAPENCSRCADAGVLGPVPGVMGVLQVHTGCSCASSPRRHGRAAAAWCNRALVCGAA